ncbi:MAG: hypothetical protein RIC35_17480 [Marinoscillum sp.]
MKKLFTLLFALCIVSFYTIAQEVSEVPEFKTGRAAGNSLENKLKKSPKKILINSFRINYQILYTDWEGTRAGVYTGKTSAELTVAFEGMAEADYQKITDDLYQVYIANFQSLGYEVLSAEVLDGHKAVKKHSLTTGGQASYAIKDGYIATTPTGFQYYADEKSRPALAGKMRGVDAVVVDINIDVPFMIDSESGASKLATKAVGGVSKVVASPSLRIDGGSDITFVDPAFLAVVKAVMKDEITIGGVFKDEKFKASSAAQTNTSYDLGHITRVYSTDVNTSKVQVAEGDPEKYKKGVAEAVNKLLVAANNHLVSFTK